MKDLKNKNKKDLSGMLSDKREELRVFRFGGAGSKTKNVKKGREIRKDIARIMTAMTMLDKTAIAK